MSTVVKSVTANGESVDFKVTIGGDQFEVCENAKVTFSIPSGVSLTGPSDPGTIIINVPKGYYNVSDDVWHLGDLAIAEQISNTFEFTVDDINLKDPDDNRFIVVATLTSSCTEVDVADNITTLVIEVVDPCTQVSLSIGVDDDEVSNVSSTDLSIG